VSAGKMHIDEVDTDASLVGRLLATQFRDPARHITFHRKMLSLRCPAVHTPRGGIVDDLDRLVLVALQKDGRQTIVNLGQSLGLSPSAMLQRVKRLEREGFIRGYQDIVDPTRLGLGQQALIAIQVRHTNNALERFERGIMRVDGVKSCYRVSGRYDYVLRAALQDVAHVGLMTKHEIAAIDGVARIETMIVFATVKSDDGWPTERTLNIAEDDVSP
jgi:Lrp/AsnC family leucine-responsive transcriptional regulator